MSEISLDIDGMKSILQSVAADLKSHSEELRQLDARVGDGDLGVTIELASQAMSDYLASSAETDIGKLLAQLDFLAVEPTIHQGLIEIIGVPVPFPCL